MRKKAATALLLWVCLTQGFWYYGADDVPILRTLMGHKGGAPSAFHLSVHTLFAWPLYGPALLLPGVAWFSILQLFLLWLSSGVIVKSLAQRGLQRGLAPWAGALGVLC